MCPGAPIASLYPSLAPVYADRTFDTYSPEALDGLDLVFLGLPHQASMELAPSLGLALTSSTAAPAFPSVGDLGMEFSASVPSDTQRDEGEPEVPRRGLSNVSLERREATDFTGVQAAAFNVVVVTSVIR